MQTKNDIRRNLPQKNVQSRKLIVLSKRHIFQQGYYTFCICIALHFRETLSGNIIWVTGKRNGCHLCFEIVTNLFRYFEINISAHLTTALHHIDG